MQTGKLEADLLWQINQELPGGSRYRFLCEKRHAQTLTNEEHEELLDLTDRAEHLEAERAAALVELARLRQVHVKVLLDLLR